MASNHANPTNNLDVVEDFFQVIQNRRSIRKYKPDNIPDADLKRMIEAARRAPSVRNFQPWRFVIVRDSKMKEFLAQKAGNQSFIEEANVVIVVLGCRDLSRCPVSHARYYLQDPMIATEHLVLAATAMGYGTCWVNFLETHASEVFNSVKKALNVPDDVYTICFVTIGVPAENPSPRPRMDLNEISFTEFYGNTW